MQDQFVVTSNLSPFHIAVKFWFLLHCLGPRNSGQLARSRALDSASPAATDI